MIMYFIYEAFDNGQHDHNIYWYILMNADLLLILYFLLI
jgi:hypothetical protein